MPLPDTPILLILLLIALAGTADASWQKVASIGSSDQPFSVAVDGTNAYVACYGPNTLDIIDLNSYTRTSVATGSMPSGVAVDGTNVYVACYGSNTLEIFQQPNCLSGYKIDDCTGLPLSGWKIVVNNSSQEWNATTNAAGFWRVCNLASGNYTVCEVPQPGWTNVTPSSIDVDLGSIEDFE